MTSFYKLINNSSKLYHLLEDDISRSVFWMRLRYDMDPSFDNMLLFSKLNGRTKENQEISQPLWRTYFSQMNERNKKIILYGAGAWGSIYGNAIEREGYSFFAYCDQNYEKFKSGFEGKPVVPPQYLFKNQEDCYVMIATMFFADEIYEFLIGHGFPKDHILPFFYDPQLPVSELLEKQYFDFPELYPKDTAFVDAGCYDCATVLRFAKWSKGQYSKIFAFEPDRRNFQHCQEVIKKNRDLSIELFEAGVGERSEIAQIQLMDSSSCSRIIEDPASHTARLESNRDEVQIIAIDDVVEDTKTGFIKMDIEGFEYPALQGARRTIMRDKPLCAISVYHKPGDVLAVMDYLHELVPEYRFWLRHYSPANSETVLYAGVN